MSIRGALLAIGALLWLTALVCWLRGRRSWRQSREAVLFLLLGLPFIIAGGFYTASSYPQDVIRPTPVPATPTPPASTPAPAPPPATPDPEPTPATRTSDSRAAIFRESVDLAQRLAVRRYPDLGRAGTAFNARFVAEYRRLRQENPAYFSDPGWPLSLADEVARSLAAPP